MKKINSFLNLFTILLFLLLISNCKSSKEETLNNLILMELIQPGLLFPDRKAPEVKLNLNYSLNRPNGMALERGGKEIWIADSGSHTVHLWNFSQGTARIVVGKSGESGTTNDFGTLARLNTPVKIALDDHSILVSEEGNHTIRRIRRRKENQFLAQPFIGQFGVTGTANEGGISTQLNSPQGIFHLSGTIAFADKNNHAIRLAYINNNTTRLLGGLVGTSGSVDGSTNRQLTTSTARFNSPTSIAYLRRNLNPNDPFEQRNFFITDAGNHTIRKIKNVWINDNAFSTGGGNAGSFEITTIAGLAGSSGAVDGSLADARFNNPNSIVADEENASLYIADTGNHSIRKIDLVNNTVTTIAGQNGVEGFQDGEALQARFKEPREVFYLKPHLFISDTGNNCIRELNLETKQVRTVLGKIN